MRNGNQSRTRVKICGITNFEDAELAIDAGADALGFNTWVGTKRFIDVEKASEWIRDLPPFVTRVALCVNAPLEEAIRVGRLPCIDLVQFHGDETPEFCARFLAETGKSFVKAVRIQSEADIASAELFGTKSFLIDAHVAGQFGGTGVKISLPLARAFRERFANGQTILAGGLKPENVAEAVAAVRPFAVDVSSGVEGASGRKDAEKMRAFVAAVSNA